LGRRDGGKAARPLLDQEPPSGPQYATQRARRKILQGWIEKDAGSLSAAEQRWNEGLAIAKSANDHEQAAGLDLSLAQMLSQQNRFAEAGEFLRDGNRHAEAFHDQYLTNYGLNAQATWLIEQARFEEALPLLDRVYAMADANGDVAFGALSNKALCLYRLGEFDQSLAVLQQLVDASSHGRTAEVPTEVYGHIGNIYDEREDFTNARRYYEKSLKLSEQRGDLRTSVKRLGNLAHLSIQAKDWAAADSYNRQALSLARKMPDRTAELHSLCDSAEILNGRGDFTGAVKLYQEVSRTDTDNRVPALLAHAGLARLYSEHGQDALADREFEVALNIVEDRQSSLAEDEFKVSFLSVLIQVHRSYIDFLMSHGRNERALEIAESSRARILQGRLGNNEKAQSVSAAAYQRLARESGLVLLSYSLGRDRSYVWVTTGSGIVSYPLPPEEKIRPLVEKYRAFIENMYNPLDTDDTSGPELYQAVLAPALERIPAGSRIVIAPDQALHALNFETLPIPTPRKHFFLEDATITITPSLNLLIAHTQTPTRASRLLLIGDPNSSDEHFPKLQNAAKEISLVEGHFPSAQVTSYREAKAVPAVYEKSPLDSFSYIHFTAHANTNRMVPLDSAIILSGDNESNKLTAREVLKHPINARLVTISACHGAGAKTYGGEGLVGFMWAFFQSGARNIIAGLWDVSDDSTAQLMDTLYGGIVQGKNPADALRNAKLALIQANPTWSRPYYWAPFQLYSRELPQPPVTLKSWRSPSPSSDKNSVLPN
jgi:CHAT domain-containing protein/Tfp pilus assembly protein PilF